VGDGKQKHSVLAWSIFLIGFEKTFHLIAGQIRDAATDLTGVNGDVERFGLSSAFVSVSGLAPGFVNAASATFTSS
jgi:hypothetical protein